MGLDQRPKPDAGRRDGKNGVEPTAAPACPVDHKTRDLWLAQAREQQQQQQNRAANPPSTLNEQPQKPTNNGLLSFLWSSSSPASNQSPNASTPPTKASKSPLSTHREISTIPRAHSAPNSSLQKPTTQSTTSPSPQTSHANSYNQPTQNHETFDPHTSTTGTWIYPSEEMFFNAMKRKNYSPRTADMATVIPIHNAVNERTWQEILTWERSADPSSAQKCGGPRLASFSGDSTRLTPRARWNAFLGYETPFDRHDWVVDRCGTRVDYVIDFYAGRRRQGDKLGPSFYLDVRPKLNSFEGVRMRMYRALGLS